MKTPAQHTPGPWTVCRHDRHYLAVEGGEYTVATVADNGTLTDTDIADARLIAAAPALLAAVRTARCPAGGWNGMPDSITVATVADCLAHGVCGCDLGDAVRKAESGACP